LETIQMELSELIIEAVSTTPTLLDQET
jgi:hypothetical protein